MRILTVFTAFSVALVLSGSGGASAQSLPRRAVPDGMRSLSTGGTGTVLTTSLSGSNSASQMTQALLRGVQSYFDRAPRVLHAIGDQSDTQVQASFSAQLGGVPVLGLIGVSTSGGAARAVVLFDAQRAFPGSIARLVRAATSGTSGGGGSSDVALTRTPIPDGSGNIGLAAGWVIRHAYKGAIDVQGPVPGSGMSLGAVIPVPYTSSDPAQAMVMMTEQMSRAQRRRVQITIIDSRPMPWQQGGRASLLRYRTVTDGQTMDYFGLIGITPYQGNQVFLYTSFIQAPPESFARIFPTALKSWGSWSINPSVLAQRMQQTAQTMRETGELLTGSGGGGQRAFDGVNAGWGQYIRGVATLEDPSRSRSEVDQSFADNVVRSDPAHFRIVPTSELVP
jgi:hypothetical protein